MFYGTLKQNGGCTCNYRLFKTFKWYVQDLRKIVEKKNSGLS